MEGQTGALFGFWPVRQAVARRFGAGAGFRFGPRRV